MQAIAVLAVTIYICISALPHHLQMLQQNTYQLGRYWAWYRGRMGKEWRKLELLLVIPVGLAFVGSLASSISLICVSAILLVFYLLKAKASIAKKPLVYTARAKRLYVAAIIITAAINACTLFIASPWLLALAMLVSVLISRFYLLLAAAIVSPIEKAISNRYINEARRILQQRSDLIKIGITGSFGKTSTKLIMAQVLNEKYQTCATPASFNTPLGITRTVREYLKPVDEVLILEMGAKQKGDIAELCELAQPQIGVLTTIGEQHLETFGSVENIIATKFELLENLPADGLAIVNGDDKRIMDNISRCNCPVITYGFDSSFDYWADNISYNSRGLAFTWHHGEETVQFSSSLLGRHMISNILAATAIASQLGLSTRQMARAIKALTPIEHRLQLIKAGNYAIIDDAFNSNPAGAKAALDVLGSFSEGKKIIITPGMVELGERQYQLNFEFGEQMAAVCDYIILVGKNHSQPLYDGVMAAGYPPAQLYVAEDFFAARNHLAQIVAAGDVVLLENDLPDTYNE